MTLRPFGPAGCHPCLLQPDTRLVKQFFRSEVTKDSSGTNPRKPSKGLARAAAHILYLRKTLRDCQFGSFQGEASTPVSGLGRGRLAMEVAILDREIPSSVSDTRVGVSGLELRVLRKGEGPPLLVLHDSLGNLGWLPLYERLASSFSVIVPDLPGYGKSDRPDWARSPRDLAILTLQLLDRLDVDGVTLVGIGFGGFVAAEMATMNQSRFDRLVLVGATGLHPREGEVLDQMLIGFAEYG